MSPERRLAGPLSRINWENPQEVADRLGYINDEAFQALLMQAKEAFINTATNPDYVFSLFENYIANYILDNPDGLVRSRYKRRMNNPIVK